MQTVNEWLFAAPWWLLAIAGAVAAALLLYALARAEARLRRIGFVAVACAAVWALLAVLVNTPMERARLRTQAMVEAYAQADWRRLASLIDEETRLADILKGQAITQAAELTHADLRHGSVHITSMQSRYDELGILVDVRVRSEQQSQVIARIVTAWRFDYRKRGDEWKLERITPLPTDMIDPAAVLRNIRRPSAQPQGPS